jgi:hypothetical protein
MHAYRHTQIGYVTIAALAVACLLVAYRIINAGPVPHLVVALLVLLACLVTFSSMTIEIKDGVLSWWFGLGLIRKDVPIAHIIRGTLVRVHWYHGWGIHLTGSGWLYNVSEFKAVEFQTGDKSFQLGTDEPDVLLAAVMACIMK